ncbi:uncharacterized protein LOC133806169 [Humulus lupulus]|uniref:uncharacterized protein LOC133806169 n=1 Tax=Humulus lupulus TaxID=3486 RepID=UPI002B4084EC|nr:uncharacterized protein LOC133806169 [Humulus lupulus]
MGQLANMLNNRPQRIFPSTTVVNPKEHCQAITLRSGKQYDEPTQGLISEEKVVEEHKKENESKEALEQMPSYAKFINDILSKKRKMEEYKTVALTEECSATLQRKLPPKLRDLGSFTISCTVGGEAKPTTVTLELAYHQVKHPKEIIEDVLVKVNKFIFLADFIVLNMEENASVLIILGRQFLATWKTLIDIQKDMHYSRASDSSCTVDVMEGAVSVTSLVDDPLELSLTIPVLKEASYEAMDYLNWINSYGPYYNKIFEELGEKETLPVIVSSSLFDVELEKLLRVLRAHKVAIGWRLADIRGISLSTIMHKILMDDNSKPTIEAQRRLNPSMKEVCLGEFEEGRHDRVYKNENNELIPTRRVTIWRICIYYQKLNKATKKYYFPFPFVDQMLYRLVGFNYYRFLDGYSGYHQISIAPEDQEKKTFTYLYGTFSFHRMPFGLCNASTTFQRCMVAIFSDTMDASMEILMDEFLVFGLTFDERLENLELVLKKCEECNQVLNWEKCHFMVNEGIVLGRKISSRGIEVDRTKISTIENIPPPVPVKGVRSFLGHCFQTFKTLKEKLTSAPIVVAPNWEKSFELMCDASDYAVRAILGQRVDKVFRTIYCASRTLNDAQLNYATTENELVAIVFAFDKFRPYVMGNKFDMEIHDKKGTKNLVVDHLSRQEVKETEGTKDIQINESILDEQYAEGTPTERFAEPFVVGLEAKDMRRFLTANPAMKEAARLFTVKNLNRYKTYTLAMRFVDSSNNLSVSAAERNCLTARVQELEEELNGTNAKLSEVQTQFSNLSLKRKEIRAKTKRLEQ